MNLDPLDKYSDSELWEAGTLSLRGVGTGPSQESCCYCATFQKVVKTSGELLRTELAQAVHSKLLRNLSWPQKEITLEPPSTLFVLFEANHC